MKRYKSRAVSGQNLDYGPSDYQPEPELKVTWCDCRICGADALVETGRLCQGCAEVKSNETNDA